MKHPITRRQVLRGSAGFTLGMPFLPSLVSGPASAAVAPGPRRWVGITTEHGAVEGTNMCPADSMLTDTKDIYSGHTIRWGALKASASNGDSTVCPVVRAPGSELTDKLLAKLNILRGFDVHFDTSHQHGCHLGNFAENLGSYKGAARPTIDHVMAWSPSFYSNLAGVKMRGVVTGQDSSMTWGWSSPQTRSGSIQKVSNITGNKDLFTRLVGTPAAPTGPAPRKAIVDRVLENYRSLRTSNRRLSSADRQRLDDHIGRLDELERRLTVSVTPTAACQSVGPSADSNALLNKDPRDIDGKTYFSLMNDIIAMAFACDTTRVVAMPVIATMVPYTGSWHQDIAHQSAKPESQKLLTDGLANTFRFIFLDLARKLDAIEQSPGTTILDTALLQWTQEAGPETHTTQNLTHLTFGSAGGAIKTGFYVDYRNRNNKTRYPGIAHRQFLGNVLDAMGVPKSEYDPNGEGGYGDPHTDAAVPPQVLQMVGSPLPVIGG